MGGCIGQEDQEKRFTNDELHDYLEQQLTFALSNRNFLLRLLSIVTQTIEQFFFRRGNILPNETGIVRNLRDFLLVVDVVHYNCLL